MSEPTDTSEQPDDPAASDPDADPGMLNPRDNAEDDESGGDPDADPGMLNPRGS